MSSPRVIILIFYIGVLSSATGHSPNPQDFRAPKYTDASNKINTSVLSTDGQTPNLTTINNNTKAKLWVDLASLLTINPKDSPVPKPLRSSQLDPYRTPNFNGVHLGDAKSLNSNGPEPLRSSQLDPYRTPNSNGVHLGDARSLNSNGQEPLRSSQILDPYQTVSQLEGFDFETSSSRTKGRNTETDSLTGDYIFPSDASAASEASSRSTKSSRSSFSAPTVCSQNRAVCVHQHQGGIEHPSQFPKILRSSKFEQLSKVSSQKQRNSSSRSKKRNTETDSLTGDYTFPSDASSTSEASSLSMKSSRSSISAPTVCSQNRAICVRRHQGGIEHPSQFPKILRSSNVEPLSKVSPFCPSPVGDVHSTYKRS